MKQDRVRVVVVLILLVAISALFVAMIRGFLMTILLAAIFSGLAQPLYKFMFRLVRRRKTVATLLTLAVLLAIIVGPLFAFIGVLTNQALEIADTAGPWIQKQIGGPEDGAGLGSRIPALGRLEPYRQQILERLGSAAGAIGSFVVGGLSSATRGTINFLFQLFIMLYAMFFFLGDGKEILTKFLSYIPLSEGDKDRLVGKFLSVSRATIKGIAVIGLVQGALAGIGFAVAGIRAPVFWGTVMAVFSIIPGLGTAVVWVPTVIYLFATGHQLTALILGLYCLLIVGSADNVLRPRLVGKDVKMHELFILFGTLGGAFFFGFVGFIVGPIVAALFITIWDIYGAVFKDALSGSGKESA